MFEEVSCLLRLRLRLLLSSLLCLMLPIQGRVAVVVVVGLVVRFRSSTMLTPFNEEEAVDGGGGGDHWQLLHRRKRSNFDVVDVVDAVLLLILQTLTHQC